MKVVATMAHQPTITRMTPQIMMTEPILDCIFNPCLLLTAKPLPSSGENVESKSPLLLSLSDSLFLKLEIQQKPIHNPFVSS